VTSKIKTRNLRYSDIGEVRKIKEAKVDKTYAMIVECGRKISVADLRRLKSIRVVKQKTPERVLHRRADKYRQRVVKSISAKLLGKKKFRLTVKCEGGLYVKELVSGDNGRTEPSVSSLLNAACRAKDLDVIRIHAR
jgi:tRNA pseudouridine synthase 10